MLDFFKSNTRLCVRIMIHLLFFLVISDLIWFILYSNVWSNQTNSYYPKIENLHFFVKILALIEISMKIFAIILLILQFKSLKINSNELFNFLYIGDIDGFKVNENNEELVK